MNELMEYIIPISLLAIAGILILILKRMDQMEAPPEPEPFQFDWETWHKRPDDD